MKIVIVGANGFIGKNLSLELSRFKHLDLTLVSRRFDKVLKEIESPNVKLIKLDYRSGEIKELVQLADVVYFLVSSTVPSTSWSNPIYEINNNIYDVVNFFQLLSTCNIGKVIYLSSGGTVYGNQKGVLNEDSKTLPFSPYGISKLTNERFLEYFKIKSGLNHTIYRVSNVYGSYASKDNFGVINTWLKNLIIDKPIELFGTEPIVKDYIYIKDVVNILRMSIDSENNESEIINLCSGELFSLEDLIDKIKEVTKIDFEPKIVEAKSSDNKTVHLDNSKLLLRFPKYVFTNINSGIKDTWENINVTINN